MSQSMNRRDFIIASGALAVSLSPLASSLSALAQGIPALTPKGAIKLELFDYHGVKLLPSRWASQYQAARDYYLSVPDDDLLKGFREAAQLPAPGKHMGGWCANHSGTVFGQWMQAMARGYRATGDAEMRDKAVRLTEGFAKCVAANGDPRLVNPFGPPRRGYGAPAPTGRGRRGRGANGASSGTLNANGIPAPSPTPNPSPSSRSTYPFEKLFGGLVDMDRYADYKDVRPLLDKMADWSIANLDRRRMAPANRGLGSPTEWYTVGENFYRAYEWMGDEKYKKMGREWQYDSYWDRFLNSSEPENIAGLHAYSHVNTFSSCAMAYKVTGDERYLNIIKNAYDWLQKHENYASGGYGPDEFMMAADGSLGTSLEKTVETFESPCGSWAGFKLSKYLMQFTGEAKYGDWIEKLLYNGIGASLPMAEGGQTFYYASYRIANAHKKYYEEAYPCCAGTYFQDVVEYHNLIYMHDTDGRGLFVNLYVPSEVSWNSGGQAVKLTQTTSYPVENSSTMKLQLERPAAFNLSFRVPAWSSGVSLKVNGDAANIKATSGTWATISGHTWKNGDTIEITIPQPYSAPAIDKQHPTRVAVMRGPVVLAMDTKGLTPQAMHIEDGIAEAWPKGLVQKAEGTQVAKNPDAPGPGKFKPLYEFNKEENYRIYFDPAFKTLDDSEAKS